jgi:hypothetical protein
VGTCVDNRVRSLHEGRVRRHAEAVADRGDHVDLLSLDQAGLVLNRVNIVGLGIPTIGAQAENQLRWQLCTHLYTRNCRGTAQSGMEHPITGL